MENKRRTRKVNRKSSGGFFTKLFANTGGNPEAIEDQDWYLDSPDLRLTRIFSVVLCLHIIAVGGILAFKMIDKASGPGSSTLAKASVSPVNVAPVQKEYSGKIATTIPNLSVPTVPTNNRHDRYCVIPGDTLSGIAVKLGVTSHQLKMTNHINSPDEIIPGMWLKKPIPVVLNPTDNTDYGRLPDHPVQIAFSDADVMNSVEKSSGNNGVVYQVQPGDTAWGISQKFGINHNDLLNHNGITRPELLQVGQVLDIPGR